MQKTAGPESVSSPGRTKLHQTMGLREVVALGIGGTIGGAIFVLVGMVIDQAGPLGALLSFVLASLVAVLILLPYTELACRYPVAGGGYAFVQVILGRHCGFLMGWVYAGCWLFVGSYVTLGFGGYFQQAVSGVLPIAGGVPPLVSSLILIIGIVGVNLVGGRLFGHVQKVIVLPVVVILVGGGMAGLTYTIVGLHGATLSHFSLALPHGMGGVLAMAPFAFLALAGLDMIATTGEEVKKPQKTLPLAILLTLGIVLLLYLLVTAATAGVLSGHQQLSTRTPLADAAMQLFGGIGQRIIAITASLITAAAANAILVAISRITFAMARDRQIPRLFAKVHPSTNVPWVAIIASGVGLALLALTGGVGLLAAIGSFLYVLQFIFPLLALIVVRRRSKMVSFTTPAPRLVIPLALGGCLLLLGSALYTSGPGGISIGLGWLVVGLVTYGVAQALIVYLRRKYYLKKGYAVTKEEIVALKDRISHLLSEPQVSFEQLRAILVHIAELKQLRAIQARIEELRQLRMAQARIEERKRLRTTLARAEELEFLQAMQASIEGLDRVRVTQAHTEEFSFLQDIEEDAEDDNIITTGALAAQVGMLFPQLKHGASPTTVQTSENS